MRSPWLLAIPLVPLVAGASPARGDDLLRGPHPFLRDNELALHGGLGVGFGDTFAGPKGTVEYGYRLNGGLWLDLGVGFLSGSCRPRAGAPECARKGDTVEVLGGLKYKLRMNVPVVPYAKLLAGLAYLFPDDTTSAVGFAARAGAGAKYFPYHWIGVGAEVTFGFGRAGYADRAPLARALAALDLLAGVELHFSP